MVVWDICCGSGCLGIAFKKALPDNTQVILSDISPEALAVCLLPMIERIQKPLAGGWVSPSPLPLPHLMGWGGVDHHQVFQYNLVLLFGVWFQQLAGGLWQLRKSCKARLNP